MKRSDLWDKPAVNGSARSGFTAQHTASNPAKSGFSAFGIFTTANRPVIEQALKKAIPCLIIVFLICVAAARGFALISSHSRMEEAVRQTTELTSAMALAALENAPALFEPEQAAAADEKLQKLALLASNDPDTDILMIDTTGTVLAATAARANLLGRSLASVFPELTSAHHPHTSGQVVETRIDGAPYQVSMHLVGGDGGMVIALHAMERMNAFWRAEVNLNVTLFAAMALLLLVVVYAYYTQINRADTTANTMSAERAARGEMLSNGEAGLWAFSPSDRRVFLDGSASMALGLGSMTREMPYRDLLSRIHPDDRRGLSRTLKPSQDGVVEADIRIRKADGRYNLFAIRAHAVQQAGRVTVSGAAIRAADGRQRVLEAARRRVGMLEAALHALPQPLALWRKDGGLDIANASFRTAYDLSENEADIRRDAITSDAIDQAVVIRRGAGSSRNASEVKTTQGDWVQLLEHQFDNGTHLTVGTDITRFKEEQQRLQVEQERLRAKVSAMAASRRKLELQCASLERALDGGNASPSRSIKTLSERAPDAALPAEIRNSITAVLGFSELMMAETEKVQPAGGKLGEYARHIHSGGKALHNLAERLEAQADDHIAISGEQGTVVRRTVS